MIKLQEARDLTVSNMDRKVKRLHRLIDKRIRKVSKKEGLTEIRISRNKIHPKVFFEGIKQYKSEGYDVEDFGSVTLISWAESKQEVE